MQLRCRFLLSSILLLTAYSHPAKAQPTATPNTPPQKKLIVVTKEAPPFAIKLSDNTWTGISIELWQDLADRLSLPFEFREVDLGSMLEQVADGSVDVAISAITVNPEREKQMDFSHPYFNSGLGLAFAGTDGAGWLQTLKSLISKRFLSAIAALALVLMAAAVGVWFFERHKNKEQFGGKPIQGLASSFWWSAVTMTTVGYGDKSPQTFGGRFIALIWMFASIIIISGFTAAIASSITVNSLGTDLLKSRELSQLRIATVSDSTGATYALNNRLNVSTYNSLGDALDALHENRADAVLYDIPLLKYSALQDPDRPIDILPRILVDEAYSIALPANSPLRESINIALLEILQQPAWQDLRFRYLGQK